MPPITGSFGALTARGFGLFSAPVALLDEYFEYVTMLLPGNGTNGAQNNTFLDSSTNNFTITRNGNTTQGTFSPYGDNWSNYFDGTGDYLTTAASNVNNFGTGDWTIEFWVNSTQTSRVDPIGWNYSYTNAGWAGVILNVSASGQISWYEQTSQRINATSTGWNNGAWNHIAVSRSGNSVRMFLNGTQVGSTYTTSFSYGANSTGFIVGVNNDGTGPLNGYISNVRIVKGTAVYTAAFTPPTSPLTAITNTSLLTCQSNRFIDNSTNAFTITVNGNTSVQRFSPFSPTASYDSATIGGSGYFDGTGDYLTAPGGTSFDFGSSSFTIEMFINTAGLTQAAYAGLISRSASGNSRYALVFNSAGSNLECYIEAVNGGSIAVANSKNLTDGAWHHIALVRNGNTFTLYVDGVAGTTTATSSNTISNSTNVLNIGLDVANAARTFKGYISNLRVVKGTAVYTADFTPPTSPVTAITNTSLLLNFTNGGIIDNAMMNDLETVGNAQISTTQSKFGGSSMYFDGTGDYIVCNSGNNSAFGSGDFTIEFWLNPSSTSGIQVIYDGRPNSTNGLYPTIYLDGTTVVYYANDAVRISGGTVSTSNWSHIALTRNGTSTKMFLNGTQIGSTYTDTNTYLNPSYGPTLWKGAFSSTTIAGYIDDLRVTKGVARYTANFTPPTAAFPTR